jgi:cytoskeletal protein CcmA (bactofilin family)
MESPKDGEKRTIVEEGTELDGSLSSTCPIVVSGKVGGEVIAPSLRINNTGSVRGKVKVEQLESKGEMSGEFEADVVRLAGVVRDDSILRAKSLEVTLAGPNDPNAVVFGTCSLEIGEMPDKEAVIRASREGVSLRPPEPVLRASAAPAEAVANARTSSPPLGALAEASDDPGEGTAALAEGRSSKRKSAAAAKRP